MTEIPETPQSGYFALVSYVPDPLASFLAKIRKTLAETSHTQAHITLLPPRPLKLPIDTTSKQVRRILRQFPPFEVELLRVRRFPRYLYLDVGQGNAHLHHLHNALNTGDLAHLEEFEFLPHLTLSGPLSPGAVNAAQLEAERAWNSDACPARRFVLNEVAFLWSGPASASCEWRRLWTHTLAVNVAAAAVTSRKS